MNNALLKKPSVMRALALIFIAVPMGLIKRIGADAYLATVLLGGIGMWWIVLANKNYKWPGAVIATLGLIMAVALFLSPGHAMKETPRFTGAQQGAQGERPQTARPSP